MGPYKRNWFVGGTVLLGLITLGFLIILFGGSLGKVFAGEKIHVTFKSNRGDGISDGSSIRYLGKQVGTVKAVQLILDATPNHVLIRAELDKTMRLSKDMTASIRIPNFLGSGAIIELDMPPGASHAEFLKGGEVIATRYVGLGVLPPEFGDLATEMRGAIQDFRQANVIGDFKVALNNFNAQMSKAGKVMESIDAVLGAETTQADLRTAIANFRQATEHARVVTANFEKISADLQSLPGKLDATATDLQAGVADARSAIKSAEQRIAIVGDQLNRNMEKVAGVLDDVKAITDKANNGRGTIGLLLNDPRLYEKIVVGTETINETVKDVQRVVRGIEQEGFPINFK